MVRRLLDRFRRWWRARLSREEARIYHLETLINAANSRPRHSDEWPCWVADQFWGLTSKEHHQ
jgi:hypothetical protein